MLEGTIPSFSISLFFFFCAFFIARKKKPLLEDIYYALFWLFGALFWLCVGVGLSLNALKETDFGDLFILASGIWIVFHIDFGLIYTVIKIFSRNIWVHLISWMIIVFLSLKFVATSLPGLRRSANTLYMHYEFPSLLNQVYFLVTIIAVLFLVSLFFIWWAFKKGKFGFSNLSSFYAFYAIIIYGGISVSRILYVKQSSFTNLFYLLIPYLIYLGYAKKEKS